MNEAADYSKADQPIKVEVILAEPTRIQRVTLTVNVGTSAREAVRLAGENGIDFDSAGVDESTAPLGIYSERVTDGHILSEGDRVEIYRPLKQDPMDLRRKRAQQSALRR